MTTTPFIDLTVMDYSRLGGKGAALARLGELGFEIPAWFAVPPDAVWSEDELDKAIALLGGDFFAVRSSGMMEDGAGHSFAGQFESHLEVTAQGVAGKITQVRASSNSPSIQTYCSEHGLPAPSVPTVLVQRMIAPRCAGVAFSADPVSGRRSVAMVSAVSGTGEKLVSGEVDGETWRIGHPNKIESRPDTQLLSEVEVTAISTLARDCETACSGCRASGRSGRRHG